MKSFLVLASALWLVGCGANGGSGFQGDATDPGKDSGAPVATDKAEELKTSVNAADKKTVPSFSIASADKLPACDADSEGFLVYVKAEKALRTCEKGKWLRAELAAPAEEPAQPGFLVAERYECTFDVGDFDSYSHELTFLLDGTLISSCSILSYLGAHTVEALRIYTPDQVGNAKGACLLQVDQVGEDTSGYMTFEFDRTTLVGKAEYKDAGQVAAFVPTCKRTR